MSRVGEIEAAQPSLSAEELRRFESAVHWQYRQRQDGIVYDDAHGKVTEAELIASAEKAFLAYEKEEAELLMT